jgi:hypothetical protein
MTSTQLKHLRRVLDTNSDRASDETKPGPGDWSHSAKAPIRPEISLGSYLRDTTDYGPIR